MKKMCNIRTFLLIAYCIPFAFLSVSGDANGTLLFYGIMLAGFALLDCVSIKTNNPVLMIIGNVLSFVSSHAVAKLSALEPMADYFKPFTSHSLITAISIAAVIIHSIIALIYILCENISNNKFEKPDL